RRVWPGPDPARGSRQPHRLLPAPDPAAGPIRRELAELLFLQLTNTAMTGPRAGTRAGAGGSSLSGVARGCPARPPPARLAVPPDGQVAGLGRLQPVQHVQDDLALVDLDLVVLQRPGARVPAPDPQRSLVPHISGSPHPARRAHPRSCTSSARLGRTGPA